MTTPVDIDKLKELQSLLSDGEWWQTVTRGPNPTSFTSDMTHVARQAAALIAKAERVDAMTEALKPFAEIGTGEVFEAFAARARNNLAVCNPDGRRLCFVNAECFDAARNALSPKESEK